MKKRSTTRKQPAQNKAAPKKPATKRPSAKPKRKAQDQNAVTEVVARLEALADKLAQTAERFAQAAERMSPITSGLEAEPTTLEENTGMAHEADEEI